VINNITRFFSEVKLEGLKITWPTSKEATSATLMVVIMACLAGLFFLLIDSVVYRLINFIISL